MNKNRRHFIDLEGVNENKKKSWPIFGGFSRHGLQVKTGWKQSKMFSRNKKIVGVV